MKRTMIHVKLNTTEYDYTQDDMQAVLEMFRDAALAEDDTVVVTTAGLSIEIADKFEGEDFNLVVVSLEHDFVEEAIELQGNDDDA